MTDESGAILSWLIENRARIAPCPETLEAWWASVRAPTARWREPVDRALARAFLADRVAYAFAAGYQAALRRLVPSLPDDRVVSLCVTEEKGNHPRAIETRLDRDPAGVSRITGRKRWATHSPHAMELLVVARSGERPDGRPRLELVRVLGGAPGVAIEPMHGVAFVPEISHGTVTLDAVPVADDDVLPGDGYDDYVKPFRTIEDVHVAAALVGHLIRSALAFGWPASITEDLLAFVAAARELALADPKALATHLALGGLFREQARILAAIEPCWALADDATRARWKRDAALLGVAGAAREKRLEAARASLTAERASR